MKVISKSRGMISRRRSSRGFTLLEIVLAVAMMVIVSLVVYQGFMSSLQYSYNTAQFEIAAQEAVKDVNSAFSAGNANGGVSDEGVYISSGAYKQVIRVNTFADGQTPVIIVGDPLFSEDTPADIAATNRHSFVYVNRPCPNPGCPGIINYYIEAGTGNIIAKCSTCGQKVVGYVP